jgi:hypothetical protein
MDKNMIERDGDDRKGETTFRMIDKPKKIRVLKTKNLRRKEYKTNYKTSKNVRLIPL